MRWVEGAILATPEDVSALFAEDQSRLVSAHCLVDTLAEFHLLPPESVGLEDLGRPDGYVTRQLARFRQQWQTSATRELPAMESLMDQLKQTHPVQLHTGFVHSDFRFGNVIVSGEGQIRAVLDWELCTIGDVLADVGFLLDNWELPDDEIPPVWMTSPPTRAGGFPSRYELLERYARKTGFDVSAIDWYRAFACWRVAVIAEGIKRRYASRAMDKSSPVDLQRLDRRVVDLVDLARAWL